MKKLKPCPFCGSELILIERTYGGTWVCCEGCYTETKLYNTEEEAIEAWNRRVTDENKNEFCSR